MRLFNTLSRKLEDFSSYHDSRVGMYSCGPTVYDHIHIGNLSAFIAADTLRRVLSESGYKVKHVMNFTDVDDKTIRRSLERYPDFKPDEALHRLTREYEETFLRDMEAIGNSVDDLAFVRATDSIDGMRQLIRELHDNGYAYVTDDGVYFSIEKYKSNGKKYGQLLELTSSNTSESRIDNDEYDKESVHDFALWKKQKDGEPAWEFELDGIDITGRPGWHIECSVMSVASLGQPFDIHTGGIDLIFPHHENEIAQSTAGDGEVYAKYFVHNEHLLVEGKKMSKSLNNFFTLKDIRRKGFDPLAFRLMVLQAHYRKQANFTWENLESAQNRLQSYREMADLRWQTNEQASKYLEFSASRESLLTYAQDDINTPMILAEISKVASDLRENLAISSEDTNQLNDYLEVIDRLLGLQLMSSEDITAAQKQLFQDRQAAKEANQWEKADEIRNKLNIQSIGIRDTKLGQIWYRL